MKNFLLCCLLCIVYNGFSQTIYIPFRQGNLWGLADTTGKLVLTPAFNHIDYDEFSNYSEKDIYFFTVLNNKKGVLLNNKEIIVPSYGYISQARNYFFCYNENKGVKQIFLYTLTGKKLNEKPFINSATVYHKDDNSRFPMFIFQTPDSTYTLAHLDSTGKKLVFLQQKAFSMVFEYDAVSVQTKKELPVKRYDIVRQPGGAFKMEAQEQPMDEMAFGTVELDKDEAPRESYQLFWFIKRNGAWTSSSNATGATTLPVSMADYDTVYENNKNDYQDYSYTNKEGKTIRYRNFLFTGKQKNAGVLFPDGKRISPQYDSIELMRVNVANNFITRKSQICFKVLKDGKYGVINQNEEVIIPLLYEEITPDFIVRQNGNLVC